MSMISNLSVKAAFAGATVLLTGASGYVGSIILEQLLRICPEVKTIFVVFRDKRNKSAKERLDDLLSSGMALFGSLFFSVSQDSSIWYGSRQLCAKSNS